MSRSVSRKRRSRGKVFKKIGRSFKSLFNRIPVPRFGSKTRTRTRTRTITRQGTRKRSRSRKQRGG